MQVALTDWKAASVIQCALTPFGNPPITVCADFAHGNESLTRVMPS